MNTAVVSTEPKKVVSVEVFYLGELGYGPQGTHTRRQWRAECLENFLAGKDQFAVWQNSWIGLIKKGLFRANFSIKVTHDNGLSEITLNQIYADINPYAIDFSGHIFEKRIEVSGYQFSQTVLFSGAIFKKNHAYFSNAIFNQGAYFSNAQFEFGANFNDSQFTGGAHFDSAIFNGQALYRRVQFLEYANFNHVKFYYDANFSRTHYIKHAFFCGTLFAKNANFFKSKFISQCDFLATENKNTIFRGVVNFENAEIQNVGHFERVRFTGEIPNFLGVDNAKTLLMFSGDEYFNKNDVHGNATDRIAQLKRLAEEQGQTDQMLMFNAFELNAKAKQPSASWVLKIVTGLYSLVSDYGRSFIRPIIFYLLLIWLGFLYSFGYSVNLAEISDIHKKNCVAGAAEQKLDLSRERAAVEYAMFRAGGVFDFTDTGKQNNAVNCRLFEEPIEPPIMRAWGIFKGIASIALLFLAALGLRNKYRIK